MYLKKALTALLLLALLCGAALPASADKVSANPLLDPYTVEYVRTQDDFLNILFLGLDVTTGDIRASGNKRTVMKSHTDVVMLLSINKTKGRMDLLSIPRDTLVYVPGVHGVYKLNAAFNTATNYNEGFRHVKDTVSWFLGGLRIDAFCAVDLAAMRTLTDMMGGIDYDLEMTYTGSSGTKYKAGYQHLDGMGIVDYVRARTNATQDANDMGRTNRDRLMMIAIFEKLKSDINMVNELWAETQKSTVNFYTDMNGIRVITDLWDFFQDIDSTEIGSHMISGVYDKAGYVLGYWNLNITDQAQRIAKIKELYGIDAQEIPYSSAEYCNWLLNYGFQATQHIRQAKLILDYARMKAKAGWKDAINKLSSRIDAAVEAFDTASVRLRSKTNGELATALTSMRRAAEDLVKLCNYPDEYSWRPQTGKNKNGELWYQDPLVNDYNKINWR